MLTELPATPEVIERLVMLGVGSTVNDLPLLLTPLAFTTMLPVVAPAGTGATIDEEVQLVGVLMVPLNLTVPVP
jgi:hypothetical protein